MLRALRVGRNMPVGLLQLSPFSSPENLGMTNTSAIGEVAATWQGLNHVTLVTPNLDATVAFYRSVLGMRVVFEAPANPHHGRHAMISPGSPGMGFHFFEVADTQIFRLPGVVPAKPGEFLPGALQHIAVTLANESSALVLRDRLLARDTPMTA